LIPECISLMCRFFTLCFSKKFMMYIVIEGVLGNLLLLSEGKS
jgi:hypothetical protein